MDKKLLKLTEDGLSLWYEENYDKSWFVECTGVEYLKNYYTNHRPRLFERYHGWFGSLGLTGHGLDLGFTNGRGIYFFSRIFPHCKITAIDFNKNTELIHDHLKNLIPQIVELRTENCSALSDPDEKYDFCTSTDFYEHVDESTYFKSIREVHRVLKKQGKFCVYLGKTILPEHINLRPDWQVFQDMKHNGFKFIDKRNDLLVFEKNETS
tara:strand:+ start:2815 stop:3444 length:630 start_codon:yes stop_codon:yes gene_type:complete